MQRFGLFISSIVLVFALLGCEEGDQKSLQPVYETKVTADEEVYRLAIHPLHNPVKLSEAYQPLIDYLNEHIPGVNFELEASRDYQAYEVKFRDRAPHLLLPNPWQTLEAIKVGYKVIAMAGDATDFKGIFIVRKDSQINTPEDLKGKVVSYPSHTALAACIMPQRYLHDHGINIKKDIKNAYVGSQESSILNALLGDSAAAATWPPPWRLFQKDYPEEAAELKVIWETPSLLNNSVMVRDDVPDEIIDQLSSLLYGLSDSEEGRKILNNMATAQFHEADNSSYDRVQAFIDTFEQDVRPVEQP